jgi:hypothetical protein
VRGGFHFTNRKRRAGYPLSLALSGAGTSDVNDGVTFLEYRNSRPSYVFEGSNRPDRDGIQWNSDEGKWFIARANVTLYTSVVATFAPPANPADWTAVAGDLPGPAITSN